MFRLFYELCVNLDLFISFTIFWSFVMYDGNKRLLNMSVVSLIVLIVLRVVFCGQNFK